MWPDLVNFNHFDQFNKSKAAESKKVKQEVSPPGEVSILCNSYEKKFYKVVDHLGETVFCCPFLNLFRRIIFSSNVRIRSHVFRSSVSSHDHSPKQSMHHIPTKKKLFLILGIFQNCGLHFRYFKAIFSTYNFFPLFCSTVCLTLNVTLCMCDQEWPLFLSVPFLFCLLWTPLLKLWANWESV